MSEPSPAERGRDLADNGMDAQRPQEDETGTADNDRGKEEEETDMGTNVTAESAAGVERIEEYYDGLDKLTTMRRTPDIVWVLSRRNGAVTMHEVNLETVDCTCEDDAYNRRDHEPCAHLAKVVLVEGNRDDTSYDVDRLRQEVNETRAAVQDLRGELEVSTRSAQADAVRNESAGDSGTSDSGGIDDPVEAATEWVESHGFDVPDQIDVGMNSQYGSVTLEKDGFLDDDEFEEWMSMTNADAVGYDGDVNYVQEKNFAEVFR